MSIPVSVDRPPLPTDNPRHAVWIDDDNGLRRVTVRNPGEERINIGGVIYVHTRDRSVNGPWVYTKEDE